MHKQKVVESTSFEGIYAVYTPYCQGSSHCEAISSSLGQGCHQAADPSPARIHINHPGLTSASRNRNPIPIFPYTNLTSQPQTLPFNLPTTSPPTWLDYVSPALMTLHLISRNLDPVFALFIGLGAAATRINREEKEMGRGTKETVDSLCRYGCL